MNKIKYAIINNKKYIVCRDITKYIGLRRTQHCGEVKKLQIDPLLKQYVLKLDIESISGIQNTLCIDENCLGIWMAKLNFKSLEDIQYQKVIDIINKSIDADFNQIKINSETYDFESILRDEIYNGNIFDNIKILDKEKTYSFGRIDLYGIDNENNKCCIELKKNIEFDDTKDQLLKYKNSNEFDRIIYCCYFINDDLKDWCIQNCVEIYKYTRFLNIMKVA